MMFNLSAGLFFPPKLAALHVRTLSAMGLCAPSPSTLLTPHGVSTSNSSRQLPLAPATTPRRPAHRLLNIKWLNVKFPLS